MNRCKCGKSQLAQNVCVFRRVDSLIPPQKLWKYLTSQVHNISLIKQISSPVIHPICKVRSTEKRGSCELNYFATRNPTRAAESCNEKEVSRGRADTPSWVLSWERGIGECRSSFRGGQAWGKRNKRAHDPSCKHKASLGFQRTHELSQC